MTLSDCRVIELRENRDPRGSLSVIESNRNIPFAMKRIFYIYGVPEGSERGGHTLKTCDQFLIALSGSFDVTCDDGSERKRYTLDKPNRGLYVPHMIWRELDRFSADCVCLVAASEFYDAADYFNTYGEYKEAIGQG